ncbi:Adenylate kinase [Nitrosococcus oceani ATCC 19707]|uniref:Adenylate kinase n=2 Tax=Nitrosococcus oceani TaxID=1229 RepID=KAD_NITOC|nr:adenylate kinase [Nitrosococcus oceani]Q3J7A3.1 RecName: Full=Adenylate kinase; Short=AK; AltName: Full=ATP-AMP transphosphorylase; AltName: Full=ATP:AMP phosphotransferase; AltName: Full=Adenylate monophosphate kinase [Nitrosococcus oceani ATCC 19707]KFI18321.1 adenylate kinase [Nitrosococcus oceani C-27]ABA59293.1 Adenylate kinase [Nitrosococcus oceani ATCC 19707]EDZ66052.1 adenylate kinases subfamily [Nitrosococcus oceani AFC27]GEM21119.1 adenylate kinase [Nitrosococcus oceani]
MRAVLLGAPGSGKGTQGERLSQQYGIPQVSTGDLLRAAVAAGSELGKQAKAAMDAGELVSDQIVIGIIRERLTQPDAAKGYILDGFPRNFTQAQALDEMLATLERPLQAIILLDVNFEVLMRRLTGRRTCQACGAIYNIYFSPPEVDHRCDKCNSDQLVQRSDDNEETISNRLRVYEAQTAPLVDYYEAQGKLYKVDGEDDITKIAKNIGQILETAR